MLKDKLKEDQKQALKSGDSVRRTLIGMVMTSIRNKEIEKRTKLSKTVSDPAELESQSQLTDQEVVETIGSEVKRRKDSIVEFEKGGRPELAVGEKQEIEMLMPYLPEQLSEEQIREEVKKTITETGIKDSKDMGKLIGAVMAKLKGRADGALVQSVIKQEISK